MIATTRKCVTNAHKKSASHRQLEPYGLVPRLPRDHLGSTRERDMFRLTTTGSVVI